MRITYESASWSPDKVTARYVSGPHPDNSEAGTYRWCEVNAKRYDIRQGYIDGNDLPPAVRAAADARRAGGVWPFYVEWPL